MRISLLALPVILLLSCSISDRLVYEDAEGVVPDSFFSSIKNNKTQKTWIIDNLGEPHLSVSGTNQGEVLTYQFTQSRYRKTSLLLVLNYHGSENQQKNYHVLLCADVVKKTWWDDTSQVQVDTLALQRVCPDADANASETVDGVKNEEFTVPEPISAASVG